MAASSVPVWTVSCRRIWKNLQDSSKICNFFTLLQVHARFRLLVCNFLTWQQRWQQQLQIQYWWDALLPERQLSLKNFNLYQSFLTVANSFYHWSICSCWEENSNCPMNIKRRHFWVEKINLGFQKSVEHTMYPQDNILEQN